jgi:hypothetical protein
VNLLLDPFIALELDTPLLLTSPHNRGTQTVIKAQRIARPRLARTLQQRTPDRRLPFTLKQQQLDAPPAALASDQPRRHHARVVDDQQVSRLEHLRQLMKTMMFGETRAAVQTQETRSVTLRRGKLSDVL